jgi:hypothetical protein
MRSTKTHRQWNKDPHWSVEPVSPPLVCQCWTRYRFSYIQPTDISSPRLWSPRGRILSSRERNNVLWLSRQPRAIVLKSRHWTHITSHTCLLISFLAVSLAQRTRTEERLRPGTCLPLARPRLTYTHTLTHTPPNTDTNKHRSWRLEKCNWTENHVNLQYVMKREVVSHILLITISLFPSGSLWAFRETDPWLYSLQL